MELRERLREMRVRAGLSQAALGERLRKHQQWVHNRETGHVRVKPDEALDWAEECGFRGAMIFTARADAGDILELLQAAPPEVTDLVSDLLRAAELLSEGELRLLSDMIRVAARQRA